MGKGRRRGARPQRQRIARGASKSASRQSGFTDPLPFDASAAQIQSALEGLGPIGAGNVTVTGTPAQATSPTDYIPGSFDITFVGALSGADVADLNTVSINIGAAFNGAGARVIYERSPANWGAAKSSLPQSAPIDSNPHDVSAALTGLDPNTTYSVRLVGTNADNHLSAYASPPDVFKTLPPPPPDVSIDSISPITTTTAHIAATIDPQRGHDHLERAIAAPTPSLRLGTSPTQPPRRSITPRPGDIVSGQLPTCTGPASRPDLLRADDRHQLRGDHKHRSA